MSLIEELGNEAGSDRAGLIEQERHSFDPNPEAFGHPSGLPALTTRGMKAAEMTQIAAWIDHALRHKDDDSAISALQDEVFALGARFPIPE